VDEGQRLLVQAELEVQPPEFYEPTIYPVDLKIFWQDDTGADMVTLPTGPPIGLPGTHNRREQVQGVISGLTAGHSVVGLAGEGCPLACPPAPAPPEACLITIHRIRMLVTVLDPVEP